MRAVALLAAFGLGCAPRGAVPSPPTPFGALARGTAPDTTPPLRVARAVTALPQGATAVTQDVTFTAEGRVAAVCLVVTLPRGSHLYLPFQDAALGTPPAAAAIACHGP